MAPLTITALEALRERLADDTGCDALLAGFACPAVLRDALRAVVQAQWHGLQAETAVSQVADMLRRDQKFAPPGRPSAPLVQLRRQQAAARQAMLAARQRLAQASQAFVQASGLALKAGQPPSEAVAAWLQAQCAPAGCGRSRP
ncbi:hypothetical protein [Stenotrophomonas mori]|uniref:Uncharacterized protein n=1 Tax=Stenotrophomonas mori TaxID=2871096 RepID=A0ABT0SI51_9GAMM|nr:hypothetical protein [Stenotrophomonas mori]MCL7714922.1 hypothetical protein [Stenotrophomonas mori]